MIRSIRSNKHWGKGSQHGIQMQASWRTYNSYIAAEEDYAKHAMLCHIYHILGGEPPPGCEGIPSSNLLPACELIALRMLIQEKATWDQASVASGIPIEKLREIVAKEQELLTNKIFEALLKFENEALGSD